MRVFPQLTELPKEYNEHLGAMLVAWSNIEHELARFAFWILGLTPKQGRLAVRLGRANETLIMIMDLAALRGIEPKRHNVKGLINALQEAEQMRDLLSHAAWLQIPESGEILIQRTKGTWTPKGHKNPVARRVLPEGLLVTASEVEAFVTNLKHLLALVQAVAIDIAEQQPASQETPRGPSLPKNPPQARREKGRTRPDPTSPR